MPYIAILGFFVIFGTARCKCEILSPETRKLTIKCCICSVFRRVRDIDTEKATIWADWDYSESFYSGPCTCACSATVAKSARFERLLALYVHNYQFSGIAWQCSGHRGEFAPKIAPKWPKFTKMAIKAHGAVFGGHCSIISDLPVI